jgi:hypothetical protein
MSEPQLDTKLQRSTQISTNKKQESTTSVMKSDTNLEKAKHVDITGEVGEITKHTMELVLTYIFSMIMKPVNNMMNRIKSNLEELEPTSIQDEYSRNQLFIKAINVALSNPETMSEWDAASKSIAFYIKGVINRIEDESLEDLKRILQELVDTLDRSAQSAILNISNGVITAICAIPIVSPFCEGIDLANVIISSVSNGAIAVIASLNAFTKLITLMSQTIGDEIQGLEKVVNMVASINKKIQGALEVIDNGKQNLEKIDDSIQQTTRNLRDGTQKTKTD